MRHLPTRCHHSKALIPALLLLPASALAHDGDLSALLYIPGSFISTVVLLLSTRGTWLGRIIGVLLWAPLGIALLYVAEPRLEAIYGRSPIEGTKLNAQLAIYCVLLPLLVKAVLLSCYAVYGQFRHRAKGG
jgi:integral membrane sensor domain MASE1